MCLLALNNNNALVLTCITIVNKLINSRLIISESLVSCTCSQKKNISSVRVSFRNSVSPG